MSVERSAVLIALIAEECFLKTAIVISRMLPKQAANSFLKVCDMVTPDPKWFSGGSWSGK